MTIPNLPQFRASLRAANGDIDEIVGKVTRRIGLDITRRVVLATPVDEGRARGNWQVEVNSMPTGETGINDPSGAQAIGAAATAVSAAPDYSTINIANNVPYIGKLNDGSSQQAPANFVENAIDASVRFGR